MKKTGTFISVDRIIITVLFIIVFVILIFTVITTTWKGNKTKFMAYSKNEQHFLSKKLKQNLKNFAKFSRIYDKKHKKYEFFLHYMKFTYPDELNDVVAVSLKGLRIL